MSLIEKRDIEKATLDYFLSAYNRLKGTCFVFHLHRDSPDFIIKDSKSLDIIGIEVTVLFYDDSEAKLLLGRSKEEDTHHLMCSDKFIRQLNTRLEEKCKSAKNYSFDKKMLLVVRNASRIFDESDIKIYKGDIIVPTNVFYEIWMLCYDDKQNKWSKLIQLK